MTKKKPSTKPSKSSKPLSKSTFGDDILYGLNQAIAHQRGEIELRTRQIYVPDTDVAAVRKNTGLSQADFAARYGFNPRTLQDWEQGRTKPDTAVLAYLHVIARNPAAVEAALKAS